MPKHTIGIGTLAFRHGQSRVCLANPAPLLTSFCTTLLGPSLNQGEPLSASQVLLREDFEYAIALQHFTTA
jgi:hypothetical protein